MTLALIILRNGMEQNSSITLKYGKERMICDDSFQIAHMVGDTLHYQSSSVTIH